MKTRKNYTAIKNWNMPQAYLSLLAALYFGWVLYWMLTHEPQIEWLYIADPYQSIGLVDIINLV